MSIYLDHNATTPMSKEVVATMVPWLERPANPSSVHSFGQSAVIAIERAREQVAKLVGANGERVIFTSGATEANRSVFFGISGLCRAGVVLTSSIEHPSVLKSAEATSHDGCRHHTFGASANGVAEVPALVPADTQIISLMAVNHETGVRQPLDEAITVADAASVPLHVDASQAAGKLKLSMVGISAMTISAHKFGGPTGVGALIISSDLQLRPLLVGGSQERYQRAGTLNTAGIVGMGAAAAAALAGLEERRIRWHRQRDRLEKALMSLGASIIGGDQERIPNTTCVVFDELLGESVVQVMDSYDVAISAGAACSSGSTTGSAVLRAMGRSDAKSAVRVSLGAQTTDDEIDEAIVKFSVAVNTLRQLA